MTDEFDRVAMENVTNQYLGGDTSLSCSADTQKETITGDEFMNILDRK